ncbi:anti-sigma factor family protein [Domibacillus aminovorans]|uniref:Anti-sigma-W factor RsiW n=1 Tax=Domibacillus aminovorans TaxID=29332 RepID=A0A177L5Y1_9BACI|nr:anti-sigma factor [Domibacillus aminovorans]OAH60161.1 anti-sigma factor [Domibacillus aminovorans]
MTSCPKQIVHYMHEYLDGEIENDAKEELKFHIETCEDCKRHYLELKKTIALVQSASHIAAPAGFTARVMALLPRETKKFGVERWLRNHPFFTAAALFLLLMGGGFFSMLEQADNHFAFTKNSELKVENETVIVPAGAVIEEDIVVKNGDIRIEGEVDGNVTVINGERYMAAAGSVTGEIEEIDRVFGRLWFEIKSLFK